MGELTMTDKQENMFSMFTILNGYLESNAATIAEIPAFQRAHTKFAGLLKDIQDVDSGRQSIKSGKSEVKGNKKNELVAAIFQITSALFTYADEHDRPEILNRVDNAESYYKRMRDSNLILEARGLVELTKGIETELVDHGLTAEEIAAVINLANGFEAAIKDLGTSEAEGSNATKTVYQLIGEAKDVVDNQLDRHVEKFKAKNSDFYEKYWSARRVIDTGTRHEKKEAPPAPVS